MERIFKALKESSEPVSLKKLALLTGISEKNVRNKIADFNSAGNKSILSSKKGYYIADKIENFATQQVLTKDILESLIIYTLLDGNYHFLSDIAENFYISLATANRMISEIKEVFEVYEIKLISSSKGLKLSGSESNIRALLMEVHKVISQDELNTYIRDKDRKCDKILKIVEEVINEYKHILINSSIEKLIFDISIVIVRVKLGYFIEENFDDANFVYEKEITAKLSSRLFNELDIKIPDNEINYLALQLHGKRNSISIKKISKETEEVIRLSNEKIYESMGFDFRNDSLLNKQLLLHINPMLSRAKLRIKIDNPLISTIKRNYVQGYECAVIIKDIIDSIHNLKIQDDELGFIAIHYATALKRQKEEKIKILIVCGSGITMALLLKARIIEQFGLEDNNIVMCGIEELSRMNLNSFDFVVSSSVLNEEVRDKLIIVENPMDEIEIPFKNNGAGLENLLKEGMFITDIREKGYKQILKKIVERIGNHVLLPDNFYDLVIKREEMSSTDIGSYIAIPHPFEICTESSFLCICILKNAVTWKKNKVKYIFLTSYCKNDLIKSHDYNESLFGKILNLDWLIKFSNVKNEDDVRELLKSK